MFNVRNITDIADYSSNIKWDVAKAKVVLNDVIDCFDCYDLDNPSKELLNNIAYNFKQLRLKVDLADNMLDSICETSEEILSLIYNEYDVK